MNVRNTFQRNIVLDAVKKLTNHPTPDEIYLYVRQQCPTISKGTVYRNIGVLANDGEVKRIEIPNAPDRVDFNIEKHYHLLCKQCGRAYDVDLPFLDNIDSMIVDTHGFDISSHDIIFRGTCPCCK